MAVRFILGRAGAGKSRYCVESLRSQLRRDPKNGPKLILLVPEQASLQTERELLTSSALPGAQRGEVLSFRRFTQRLLQAEPSQSAQILSAVGRVMVLQKLAGELRSELQYFRADRLLPGLYNHLSLQIEEFITAAVTPDDLAPKGDSQIATESLRAKLADLRLLYSAYLSFLRDGYVDPAMTLDQARKNLSVTPWITGARIWVDGFASFSQQEAKFLVALAKHASQMEISLLIDPQMNGIGNDEPPDPYSLFSPTAQTYHKLLADFRRHHLEINPPLLGEAISSQLSALSPQSSGLSPHQRGTSQSAIHPDLQHLEAYLFSANRPYDQEPTNIALFQAGDPREEMRYVVQQIVKLTSRSDQPLRYRDIAIITRQLSEQHSLIANALQSNNIPHFVDRRPPLSEHPLYFFLRAILSVAVEQFSTDSVRQLLKADLLGLDSADADQLENYIIAHRIAGLKAWTRPKWQRDPSFRSPFDDVDDSLDHGPVLRQINATRQGLLERLSPWISTDRTTAPVVGDIPMYIGTVPLQGLQWAQLLYRTIEHMHVPEQIEDWAIAADRDGLAAEAAHHRQAWRGVVQLFDDFVIALGPPQAVTSPEGGQMTRSEFAQSFEAGLSQLDTGLVPPAVDQIVVGSIERSRHPGIRVAFVLGMNDGAYPLTRSEELLLNDDDRRRLVDSGLNIDPPRSARLGEERLLAYIALTRPKEHLFISYSETDLDGRKLEPSPYLKDLKRVFPELETQRFDQDRPETQLGEIVSAAELITALAANLALSTQHSALSTQHRQVWNTVYDRARFSADLRSPLREALRSLVHSNQSTLSPQLVDALHRQSLRTSITNLEQYAACPFQYFAAVQLKLKPRPTGEIDALQLGALYHAVLDSFTRQLIDDNVPLRSLADGDIEARLSACIRKFNPSIGPDVRRDWAGDSADQPDQSAVPAFLWERLRQELMTALCAHRTIQAAGEGVTLASELSFGMRDPESLPSLELDTPKGRRVLLRGKIDRVDTAEYAQSKVGFVFDYKRSRERLLKLSEVYHGVSLQLMVYLLGLEALGKKLTGQPIVPGGAFYLPLIPDYTKVEHPAKTPENPHKTFRPRGIYQQDMLPLLHREHSTGSSTVIAAILNKDGSFSKKKGSDAAGAEDFHRLMKHVRFRVGQICDDILDGQIPVRPYRLGREMPCQMCDYRPVCRFEFPESTFQRLGSLEEREVWDRLRTNA